MINLMKLNMEYPKKKKKIKIINLLFIVVLLVSCKNQRNFLEEALDLAGENRKELEEVLQHYTDEPLKLKSAEFLIENMVGHYSFVENKGLTAYYNEIDSLYEKTTLLERAERIHLYDSISSIYNNTGIFEKVSDLHVITADFLIDNIDRSFKLWQEGEWAKHISFEDFCEYLLPYKVADGQTLDNWKEYANEICSGEIDFLHYCSVYKNLAYKACEHVNARLSEQLNPIIEDENRNIPIKRVSTSMKTLQGTCDDYSFIATALMRAKGIPVAIDYTPQWPFRNYKHSWNVLLDNYGKNIVFVGCEHQPGLPHKVDHRMAKVFRRTYAVNRELEQVYRRERYLPPVFNDLCIKDVTCEYMDTYDVQVVITNKTKSEYVYLAVFDNQKWVPVHWGKIKGHKVKFERMGTNIVYLPVACAADNKVIPIAPPFVLNCFGEKTAIVPNQNEYQTLNLYRKYYIPVHAYNYYKKTIGAKIQASNFIDFRDSIILFTIREPGINAGKITFKENTEKYQYWRYLSPEKAHCNIAELYFFEKSKPEPIYGKIMGTEGTFSDGADKENVFDRNPLTIFDSDSASGAWVGQDFGRPVAIEKILYIPRSDGNSIIFGNEYELVYWNDGNWVSLGRKRANNNFLEYSNCPRGALYLLHNRTTGIEERIFTYENNEQIWW